MARTYATIDAGIWSDEEFCSLSAGAQRTYFMLITQTDITACGSLALTLRRWSKTCSEQDLKAWLEELAEHRFVLIDEDTEELLVRTFAKWDGGYKHPKRRAAVIGTAKAIRSHLLRTAIAVELEKLGVSLGTPVPLDSESNANEEAPESRRSVVTEVSTDRTPETTLLGGEPFAASGEPPSEFCSKHPRGTDKPCTPCGRARQQHANWVKREARLEQARRQALDQARRACPDCRGSGWLEDDAGNPTRKCDHRKATTR